MVLPPVVPYCTELWHITPTRYRDAPLHFGKGAKNRFDDPDGIYGTLYASPDLTTAFLESVLHDKALKTVADRIVSKSLLAAYVVKPISQPNPLALAHLSAAHALANMGYNNSILTDRVDYGSSQNLSRILFDAMPNVDGLVWFSRQGGSTDCIVLFERSNGKLDYQPPDMDLLTHPDFAKVVRDLHLVVPA